MCTANIRGHEANFYEAEARCHEAEIEAAARKSEAEAEAARPNDLGSRPHGPRGLDISAEQGRRNRRSMVSGCSPNFWGAGAVYCGQTTVASPVRCCVWMHTLAVGNLCIT